jgi:hypothetical protein
MLRRLAALSLISSLAFAASVKADEPPVPVGPLIITGDSSKAIPGDLTAAPSSKAAFDTSNPAVRLAMCGVEADAGNADLDAGLIDFKTPDPHAAGRFSDDPPQAGRNVPDYRSSVFLGVTLGYHF